MTIAAVRDLLMRFDASTRALALGEHHAEAEEPTEITTQM
jgi:hypothetical protein